jgi:putative membrane protein
VKHVSARAARAGALVLWTGFFGYLWIGREAARYLGPRTQWVVEFGAVALGLVTLAYGVMLRSSGTARRLSLGESLGLLVLLVPFVAVLLVPNAELGAQAAAQKSFAGTLQSPGPQVAADASGTIDMAEIHYAGQSAEYARAIGVGEGTRVSLLGFVTHSSDLPASSFGLTRFYISCCAADAIPYTVAVETAGGGDFPDDTWLHVTGTMTRRGDRFVVIANRIGERPAPSNPYLY